MKILVIGDSCQDVFVYGECKRLNPEAPTPVFTPIEEKKYSGMAANVVSNLESLGNKVDFITNHENIVKKRIVDLKSNYILIRIDEEHKLQSYEIADAKLFQKYDAVVISDYNKGFLNEETLRCIIDNSKLSFIDTKKPFGEWIVNASYIKINESESLNPQHDKKVLSEIQSKLIVTMGSRGCKLKDKIYPTVSTDIMDVVGAGDSFFAGLVSAFLEHGRIDLAIQFANLCGLHAVKKKGISTLDELIYNK